MCILIALREWNRIYISNLLGHWKKPNSQRFIFQVFFFVFLILNIQTLQKITTSDKLQTKPDSFTKSRVRKVTGEQRSQDWKPKPEKLTKSKAKKLQQFKKHNYH